MEKVTKPQQPESSPREKALTEPTDGTRKKQRPYNGAGRRNDHTAKALGGKRRSWNGR